VRELDSVDDTFGTDNVGNVTDGRSRCGTEVKNLASGTDLFVRETTLTEGTKRLTWMSSRPPKIPAASLLLKGFHTRYSTFSSSPSAFVVPIEILFSP
jgi:hypothetical protein